MANSPVRAAGGSGWAVRGRRARPSFVLQIWGSFLCHRKPDPGRLSSASTGGKHHQMPGNRFETARRCSQTVRKILELGRKCTGSGGVSFLGHVTASPTWSGEKSQVVPAGRLVSPSSQRKWPASPPQSHLVSGQRHRPGDPGSKGTRHRDAPHALPHSAPGVCEGDGSTPQSTHWWEPDLGPRALGELGRSWEKPQRKHQVWGQAYSLLV